jgi:CRP/FNR family cyclic AMP-dependent transcriptional regulator
MTPKSNALFDPKIFLAKVGDRWTIEQYSKSDKIFSQGDPANAVFYIQKEESSSRSSPTPARKRSSQF